MKNENVLLMKVIAILTKQGTFCLTFKTQYASREQKKRFRH
jgi:hypothetical protein